MARGGPASRKSAEQWLESTTKDGRRGFVDLNSGRSVTTVHAWDRVPICLMIAYYYTSTLAVAN